MRQTSKRPARGEGGQAPAASAGPRTNLYDEVTQRIIAELEAGRFPWVQPWSTATTAGPGLPRNALTARRYSGVNVLLLWGAAIGGGFPSQSWLTLRQAVQAGGCVRKGERGTIVVYADRFVPKKADQTGLRGSAVPPDRDGPPDSERERARESGEEARAVPFLKRFVLFNVAQCDGLRDGLADDPAPLPEREIIPAAEALIEATGADFRIGGARAFYAPSEDFVQVPPQLAFHEQINYYRTCFHELGHWSGANHRLNRDMSGGFGSKSYAREELVAEMSSAFVCASLGIIPTVRHADYLASWIDLLKEDNRAVFRAASQASKAADFLLAFGDAPDGEPAGAAMARDEDRRLPADIRLGAAA